MKFLCVPCDSPMKLQTVVPPDRGSLSVVYSCPECGYEIAMLTNAYETQVVQSLGVQDRSRDRRCSAADDVRQRLSVPGDDSGNGERDAGEPASRRSRPLDRRSGSQAREHSRVRPPHGEDRHREIRARDKGRSKWTRKSSTQPKTSSACDMPSARDLPGKLRPT